MNYKHTHAALDDFDGTVEVLDSQAVLACVAKGHAQLVMSFCQQTTVRRKMLQLYG